MLPAIEPSELSGRPAVPAPPVPGEPLGIVAGGGSLPRAVADAAAAAGWRPVVVTIADAMSKTWDAHAPTPFRWGRTGDVFPHLKARGVRNVVFCGTISARPDYRSILPSLRTLALFPEILRIVRGGDDTLLRAVARAFERRGLRLRAVHEFVPELLAPAGTLTPARPTKDDELALVRADEAARLLGAADIGQAVVASAERVIALEGIEGTREMLARVADLRARGRLLRGERCVLVKSVKPQQDRRFDLPSIGAETIRQAREAGLVGVGVTAGGALLIGVEEIVAEAEAGGLFVHGITETIP